MRLNNVRYPCVGATHKVRSGGAVDARLVHSNYTADSIADKISRVDAIKDDPDGDGTPLATPLAAYSYNGVGRIVVEDYQNPDVKLDYVNDHTDPDPGSGEYEGFDRLGRVKSQTWHRYKDGAVANVDQYTYGHDRNSNRLYRENTLTPDKDQLYAYDHLNRLTTSHRGDLDGNKDEIPVADRVRGEAWGLSPVGNWNDFQVDDNGDGDYVDAADLDQDRTHNDVNEITGISELGGQSVWAEPAWSARGNMTTVPKPTAMIAAYTCTYDAWNRLVEVKDGANVVAKFEYDGLNRRIKKFINTGEDETYDEFRHFFYNNAWQVLETRKSTSENTQPETLQPEYQYIWSLRYIDSPVLRDENKDGDDDCIDGSDERLYYLNDANMNVTALVQGLLGHEHLGKVVERYMYDPYGKVTALHGDPTADADGDGVTEWNEDTSPDWDNCILYCGYYRDPETGLYHVRNRMYHIYLSWLQRDPTGYEYVDGMSLYEYVGSSPVAFVDWAGGPKIPTAVGAPATQPTQPVDASELGLKARAQLALAELLASVQKEGPVVAKASGLVTLVAKLRPLFDRYRCEVDPKELREMGKDVQAAFVRRRVGKPYFVFDKPLIKRGVRSGRRLVILHEAIHAYQHFRNWNQGWDKLSRYHNEELATAGSSLAALVRILSFNEWKMFRIKGVQPDDKLTRWWTEMWGRVKTQYEQEDVYYHDNTNVKLKDTKGVWDANAKLDFRVSCRVIRKALLAKYLENRQGDPTCIPCPKGLPAELDFTPEAGQRQKE